MMMMMWCDDDDDDDDDDNICDSLFVLLLYFVPNYPTDFKHSATVFGPIFWVLPLLHNIAN